MRRLALFDVDGTLLDSRDMIVACAGGAFAACGLTPPPSAAILQNVGLSLPVFFTRLAGKDAPEADLAQAYKTLWRKMRASPDFAYPLFSGADALVRALARRDDMCLGIATGKSRGGIDDLIARCDWEGLFSTIHTADDAPSKPSPEMIYQALRQTAIAAKDCVMIGDTVFDMEMARAAGARALGVSWGHHSAAALLDAGAELVATDFGELARALA